MSLYTDLLRLALGEDAGRDEPVADLVARVVQLRTAVAAADHDPAGSVAAGILYDVALIQLCDRVGVGHDLLDDHPRTLTRARAETRLVEYVPSLARTFA